MHRRCEHRREAADEAWNRLVRSVDGAGQSTGSRGDDNDAAGADETARPVLGIVAFYAHDAAGTGGVDELARADNHADV